MIKLIIPAVVDSMIVPSGWGIVGAFIGGILTYLTSKNKGSTEVEIAKINSSSNKLEEGVRELKKELREITDCYNSIRTKYKKAVEKNDENLEVIKDYKNLLRHYRFIFKLSYDMIRPKLEGDSEAIVLLEEVREMFSENFKL